MNVKLSVGVLCLLVIVSKCYGQQEQTPERELLNAMMPKILLEEYTNEATREGYNFSYKTSDGSVREEVGVIMNPGTDKEELVVMGVYGYEDGETRTMTMYTADKNGYRPRVQIKNRKLNPKLLGSLVG
ncbi:endocuticle structural glycoprotein ABD-5 [Hermetia illucens]|nr:endocuticle structural glycoprotein ABD-5 [Hermetia illucens]XP_037908643.1 endocuticle structural glycoprotein ABD-5 [Hermetia illucens]XP_037908644.1 endocuticle structural glycoprotein ABD-5 [Hermetia illucens]